MSAKFLKVLEGTGTAAAKAGSSSRGALSFIEHQEVNGAVEKAAAEGNLFLLHEGGPADIELSNFVPADRAVQSRVEGLIARLGDLWVNVDVKGKSVPVNLRTILEGYHILCAKTDLEKQGHSGLDRRALYLMLPGGLDELAKMSDSELIKMLTEEALELFQREYYKPLEWNAAAAQAVHDQAIRIIQDLGEEINKAVGGEDFRGLDTKAQGKLNTMALKGTDLKDIGDLNVEITAIVPFVP